MTITELESLQARYEALMAEYRRVGEPLIAQAVAIHDQIRDIKRERGQLFYAEYMRYFCKYTDEYDTLEDAKLSLSAMEEAGECSGLRIYGPGIELKNHEWDQP